MPPPQLIERLEAKLQKARLNGEKRGLLEELADSQRSIWDREREGVPKDWKKTSPECWDKPYEAEHERQELERKELEKRERQWRVLERELVRRELLRRELERIKDKEQNGEIKDKGKRERSWMRLF